MIKYLILLCAASLVLSFPGSFNLSFSRTEIITGSIPQLSDHFLMINAGSNISISPGFDLVFRGGYGSSSPSVPVDVPDSVLVSDEEGRIWRVEAGADYRIISQSPFFIRGTAGSAFIMRDYSLGENERRYADGGWESLISVGLGSEFPLDFVPVISSMEFLVSAEWIGSDVMVVVGEMGIGI